MAIVEKRYAQALFNIAKNKEENTFFNDALTDISKLFSSNLQFKKILLDPRLTSNIKLNIVKEIFPEYDNKVLVSFVGLLLDKNRINIIDGVADEYNRLTALVNNELNIKIISASTLNETEINGIADKYKKMYNAGKINYEIKIDEELLGGVKVIVGNKIYDGSLRTQLKNML